MLSAAYRKRGLPAFTPLGDVVEFVAEIIVVGVM